MKKIVLTGGGTMGHISPNLALIPKLTHHFDEIHYIGSENGIEREKIEHLKSTYKNLTYHPIPATKLNRRKIIKNFCLPFILMKSIRITKKLLRSISPDVIFSKGGYVSVPVSLSAGKLGIPLVIHESDLSMGLANKIASKRATTICTTFPETAKHFKNGVSTGSPISTHLLCADKSLAIKKYSLKPNLKTICITGGSLGSVTLNDAIHRILPTLSEKYNIIHITGKGKRIQYTHPNYHQEEFTSDIGSIFKVSDLVISRAGSNTIFELATLKIPMLLVPLSKKSSRGDQIENARYFKLLGIAEVIEEENLKNLQSVLEKTLTSLPRIKTALEKQNLSNGLPLLLDEIVK